MTGTTETGNQWARSCFRAPTDEAVHSYTMILRVLDVT